MKKGIEINVKILQFGNTQIEISRDEEIIEEISRQPIIYGEPTKTNYQAIEICFTISISKQYMSFIIQ